uniref:Nodule-specific cysteine-rich peptide L53 n=1 Tax=Lens culinaris TaxID=3864 RepID=A0A7T8DV99_LENCU|nr:nodule-specific cysteine-rich peptide L53 [Lens culinaris]
MGGILKFINALIIFLPLIILVLSNERNYCFRNKDCEINTCYLSLVSKCRFFMCHCTVAWD